MSLLHPREAEGRGGGRGICRKEGGAEVQCADTSITKKVHVIDDPSDPEQGVPGARLGSGRGPHSSSARDCSSQSGVESPLPQKDLLRGR